MASSAFFFPAGGDSLVTVFVMMGYNRKSPDR
jgi:hypothetical protein